MVSIALLTYKVRSNLLKCLFAPELNSFKRQREAAILD